MTRVDAFGSAGSAAENPRLRKHRKSVLICPRCDHESLVDGDWIVQVEDDRVELHCPVCRTHLTTRYRE